MRRSHIASVVALVSAFVSSSTAATRAAAEDGATPLPEATASAGDFEVGLSAVDGAYVRTHDRSWVFRIGILAQLRASASSTPDPSRQFEIVPVMSRIYLQGNMVEPWVRYFLQTEFAGQQNPFPNAPVPEAPRLLDMWAEAQPHEAFGVRVGLMRPPFTRSWITGLQRQLLFDRSDANLFFRTHGVFGGGSQGGTQPVVPWDRGIGVMIYGTPADGLFEYYLGVYNGNGFLFGRQESLAVMPMIRVALDPLGRVAYDETPAVSSPHQPFRIQIGAAAYYNHYNAAWVDPSVMPAPAAQTLSEEQYTLGTDLTVQFESVYLSTEIYYRKRRTVDGTTHDELGAMGVAGWMFWAPLLEVAARFSLVDPNLSTAADFRQAYDVELNVYPAGNNIRFGLRYTVALNDAAAGPVPAGMLVHTVGIWSQLFF